MYICDITVKNIFVSMAPKTIIALPIEIGLRVIGVWPNSSCRIFQRAFWITVMGTCLTCQTWYCIYYHKTADLPDLLDGLTVTISNTLIFVKLIILWFNYRILYDLLVVLLEDWSNRALTDQSRRFMNDNYIVCSRISNCLAIIDATTCILYSASNLLGPDDNDEELGPDNRKLLLKMRFPFEMTTSPLYEVITLAQFLFECSVSLIAGMITALFAALVLHAGSQIDIICQELNDLSDCNEEERAGALKNIVLKHQRIIYFSENIKNLLSHQALVEFSTSILVTCFLGYVIITSLGTEEGPTILAKCFPYYVAVNFQAFVLCCTGEYLMSKSETIHQAAYNMLWYNLNPRDSRVVLLILLRAQRLLTLTGGKFIILCMESFANMLKASASYISLLLAMY